jgi:hypothetical protein
MIVKDIADDLDGFLGLARIVVTMPDNRDERLPSFST